MRVLHVLHQSLPTLAGGTIRSRDILESQKRIGIELAVITSPFQPPRSPGALVEEIEGIEYHRTYNGRVDQESQEGARSLWQRIRKSLEIIPFCARTLELARSRCVDVIHAHSTFFAARAARKVARKLRKPLVYEVRSLWEERGALFSKSLSMRFQTASIRLLETRAMRLADHVVALNETLRDELLRRSLDPGKITVVPNAVNTLRIPEREATLPAKAPGDVVFGYVGNLSPIEGLELLVDVFAGLARQGLGCRLAIFGRGPSEASLREHVRLRGAGNVEMAGTVEPSMIASAYDRIDVVVNPRLSLKLTETVTPLKPLEAMAYRKLVLASNVAAMRELIADGSTGFLFQAGDASDLARAIRSIIAMDRTHLRAIIERAREHVMTHRNWLANARTYLALYEKLVGREGAAGFVPGVRPASASTSDRASEGS